jgi:F0F1-type ATP synthase assembly protein I
MNFNLDVITSNAIVIVPIIIAIVQAIKLTGFVKDHFSPLVAILVGVLIGWLGDHNNPDFSSMLLSGVVYGLMASGLYSGVKTTMVARTRMKQEEKREAEKRNHNHNKNNHK